MEFNLPLYKARKRDKIETGTLVQSELDENILTPELVHDGYIEGYLIDGENTYIVSKKQFYNACASIRNTPSKRQLSTACWQVDKETLEISFDNGVSWNTLKDVKNMVDTCIAEKEEHEAMESKQSEY